MLKLELPNEKHRDMYSSLATEWSEKPDFGDTTLGAFFGEKTYEELLVGSQKLLEGKVDGMIPLSLYFLLNKDIILGTIDVRHRINNEFLKTVGGHIGYGIRPSERHKGYGSDILSLGVQEAIKLGIEKILVCCQAENIISEKTILNNGGKLENQVQYEGDTINRYWITP